MCASMRKVEVEYICEKVSEDMGGAIVTTILFELKASLHVVWYSRSARDYALSGDHLRTTLASFIATSFCLFLFLFFFSCVCETLAQRETN